ncbi:MAG: putative quinol monooxygenase [Alphaproteobacteria bacterium]
MSEDVEQGGPVHEVAYVEAAPEAADAVAAALGDLAAEIAKADGALGFLALRETGRPARFAMLGVWRDAPACDRAGEAIALWQDRMAARLAAPFDRRPSSGFLVAAEPGTPPAGDAVHILTHVDVPPPSKDICIGLLHRLVAASRNEAGALRFDALQQENRPNHFTLIEVWRDRAAWERHLTADHTSAFRRDLTPLLGALYDERLYEPLR